MAKELTDKQKEYQSKRDEYEFQTREQEPPIPHEFDHINNNNFAIREQDK